jgi:flavodoxin
MKTAVAYYSFDGNTAFVGDEIAKVLKADKFVIEPVKEIPHGIMKYIFGGKQSLFNEIPEILDLDFNSDSYQRIILASPCWASTVAPAMKSFMKKFPLKNKEIALLLCHAGEASKKTFEKWASLLDGSNKIVAELKLVNPLRFHPDRSISFAANWSQDIWEEIT